MNKKNIPCPVCKKENPCYNCEIKLLHSITSIDDHRYIKEKDVRQGKSNDLAFILQEGALSSRVRELANFVERLEEEVSWLRFKVDESEWLGWRKKNDD